MKKIIRLQIENPKTLDPIYGLDTVSGDIINACYDRLFTFENNHCQPLLLEEYFNDGENIYCKLKKIFILVMVESVHLIVCLLH